jgi:hypothetical protein
MEARFPDVPIYISDIGAVLAIYTSSGVLGLMTCRL